MLIGMLRWFARNLSTMLLAFILALAVWVSAVVTADPNEKNNYQPIPVEQVGQDPNLLLVEGIPAQVQLTLEAPRSIWNRLNSNGSLVHAWIDLTGLESGVYTLPVKTRIDASPVRFIQIEPQEITVVLEPLARREVPVQLTVSGELPLGYQADDPVLEPLQIIVSGPASKVAKVVQARANLNITGAIETINKILQIEALDENGNPVANLTLTPRTVDVTQPVSLLGGFKNVVVKIVTRGQVADGYRLTNISVSPPTVTIFSDDPQLIEGIPGYVDTMPVNLANLSDDTEINVDLNLPKGITLVREPSVLVQVSVAAIEGSLTLTLPVEVVGLLPELAVTVSPAKVDIIVAGPLNVLKKLTPSSFRVILDVSGLPPGVYQRPLAIDLLPDTVRVQTTLPETVEVTLVLQPTPTPSPLLTLTPALPILPTSTP